MASKSSILTYYDLKNRGVLKNQRENAILRLGHLNEFTYHDIMHITGMIQGSSARVLNELHEQGYSVFKKMLRGESTVQVLEWTNKGKMKYKEISERS